MDREAELARRMGGWTIRREAQQYSVDREGEAMVARDVDIFARHGYRVVDRQQTAGERHLTLTFERQPGWTPDPPSMPLDPGAASQDQRQTASPDIGPAASQLRYKDPWSYRLAFGLGQAVVYAIALGAVALVVAGGIWVLSLTPEPPSRSATTTACERAFIDASDGSVEVDVEYDLDPAMTACDSLAEWTAAWRRYYLSNLAGDDPRMVAENRCLSGKFEGTPICSELDP